MHKKYTLLFLIPLIFILTSVSVSLSNDKAPEVDQNYIGAETCKGCHETQYESYAKSSHSRKQVHGPEYKEACETCHGAGAQHVEKGGGRGVNIFDFGKKVNTETKSAKCLSCHENSRHLVFWDNGRHKTEGISCDNCHSVHGGREKNLKAAQPDLCFDCHKEIRMLSNRQSHHPVQEGKMNCTDCHNPHGGFGEKMVKADSVNELCFECHAEKRGPFLLEHQPVVENCLTCHNVHGSNHNSMLVRKTPQLCQNCHGDGGHPGRPYGALRTFKGINPRAQMYGRNCMNCHTNIHGSSSVDGFTN